jgi:mono/diheme cytochrome c family protein
MFMDTVVSFGMFIVIFALAVISPASLDDKADPNNTAFVPYPAWYFMALFALLNIVGQVQNPTLLEILDLFATVIVPGGLVLVLIILPFVDRNPSRRLSRRPWVLGLTAATMFAAVALSVIGQVNVQVQQVAHGVAGPGVAQAATPPTGPNGAPPVEKPGDAGTQVAAAGGGAGNAAAGATVFSANCAGCHGAAGAGQPGVFPPLANNPYVTGDPKEVIHTLNYGLQGSIKVGSATYNGQMPAWKGNLTDQQIADVVTYIRSSWGNKASAVTVADVKASTK